MVDSEGDHSSSTTVPHSRVHKYCTGTVRNHAFPLPIVYRYQSPFVLASLRHLFNSRLPVVPYRYYYHYNSVTILQLLPLFPCYHATGTGTYTHRDNERISKLNGNTQRAARTLAASTCRYRWPALPCMQCGPWSLYTVCSWRCCCLTLQYVPVPVAEQIS